MAKNSQVEGQQFSEISGGRFDPDYFSLSYNKIIKAISTAGYDKIPLKQITTLLKSGKTPSSQDYSEEETEYPIITIDYAGGKGLVDIEILF